MTALFIVRAARLASLPVTTTLPLLRVLPYAMPSRTAVTGVKPTFTRPETPREPNRLRLTRRSRTTLSVTMAPLSTVREG